MISTNRLMDYYKTQRLVPFEEVASLEADAWDDGYRKGSSDKLAWYVVCVLLGFVLGIIVSFIAKVGV